MSVSLSTWVTTGGGASAINLGNASLLSVTGASSAWNIQALVNGVQYTIDGPTYTTQLLAQAALVALVGAVSITSLQPPGDPTVTTGNVHDV